ncbi:MAG: hypothetical protein JXB50_08000 [Spirochaetes bacterium]|nr:hypothetical protein [Spirochaetota bacterium]
MNIDRYSKYADNLIFDSQEVVFSVGQAYKELQKSIIKDPTNIDKYKKIYDKKISKIAKEFDINWKKWADEDLPTAYIKGIKDAENNLSKVGVNSSITDPITNGRMLLREFPIPPAIPAIPGQVSMLFSGKYADHETFFGVFRQSAYYSLDGQQVQIMRYSDDLFRQTASMVAENNFNEMDIFTRRKFSQEMLDEFARKGVQSITYKNGARYSIDTYSEMVGRTLTSRCAIQANLNRYMQSGWDLVIVSAHFMCCELCSPYEGQTLSINPGHQVYESLDDAIRNGLYHCNCIHDLSPYFEGISDEIIPSVSDGEQRLIDEYGRDEAQKIAYEAKQKQRYIERKIRNWKRRETVSIDSGSKDFSSKKVRIWQAKQREHLKENPYLPRKYEREQIKKAH